MRGLDTYGENKEKKKRINRGREKNLEENGGMK